MTKDDGGPAFAAIAIGPAGDTVGDWGMSLRDWFAGQALAGLLAHPDCQMVGKGHERVTKAVTDEAYFVADAMLAARKGGPDEA